MIYHELLALWLLDCIGVTLYIESHIGVGFMLDIWPGPSLRRTVFAAKLLCFGLEVEWNWRRGMKNA